MQRSRLTITLDNELMAALDTLVDKDLLRNRSHAIEHFLKEGLGLHSLNQAFLFFKNDWQQTHLESILTLCQSSGITTLFICLRAGEAENSASIQAICSQFTSTTTAKTPFTLISVPADFGDAAGILLQKEALNHSFLLAWVGNYEQNLPTLIQPYIFHHQHRAALTLLMEKDISNNDSYRSIGLALAQPEIIQFIPAGLSSLVEDVFPALEKASRVRAYVLSRA